MDVETWREEVGKNLRINDLWRIIRSYIATPLMIVNLHCPGLMDTIERKFSTRLSAHDQVVVLHSNVQFTIEGPPYRIALFSPESFDRDSTIEYYGEPHIEYVEELCRFVRSSSIFEG